MAPLPRNSNNPSGTRRRKTKSKDLRQSAAPIILGGPAEPGKSVQKVVQKIIPAPPSSPRTMTDADFEREREAVERIRKVGERQLELKAKFLAGEPLPEPRTFNTSSLTGNLRLPQRETSRY